MTVQEVAKLWKLSEWCVQKLCKESRIEGVLNVNRIWLIPKKSKKPSDGKSKDKR